MTKEELGKKAREWIEEQDFLWLSVTETERLIKAYEAGQSELADKCKELEQQIEKMKRCEICKHYQLKSCNYHSNWVKDCKANGMKLFELKEIKEK